MTDGDFICSFGVLANEASYKTAEAVGMHFDCEYPDEANGIAYVSGICREAWENS